MRPMQMVVIGCALFFVVPGCRQSTSSESEVHSASAEHGVGPHGGMIAEVSPRAHAEMVCTNGATLDIYFLDEEIRNPVTIDDEIVKGFGIVLNQGPLPVRLTFKRVGGADDNHFQAPVPPGWHGKHAAVVFPKVVIADQRWHFDFELDVPSDPSPTEPAANSLSDDDLPADRHSPKKE